MNPNFSRLASACTAALILMAAPLAHADLLSFDFSAHVTEMTYYAHTTENGPGPGVSVASSSYAGNQISMGGQVQGHFFYDTTLGQFLAQPPVLPGAPSALYGGPGYASTLAGLRYSVDGGVQFKSLDTPVISMMNNSLIDSFHMVAMTQASNSGLIQEVGLDLIDMHHVAFSSVDLPSALPSSAFTSMAIYNSFMYAGHDDALNVTMVIDTLAPGVADPDTPPPPPVPEPQTWAMLLLGLGLLGRMGRRGA